VTPAGCRSFVLRYSANGKDRLMVIGRCSDWSVRDAIKEARKPRNKVDVDEDPLGARTKAKALRPPPTLAQVEGESAATSNASIAAKRQSQSNT
jgi:hypothetical protein